jgi:hypothetical protein
MCLRKTLFGHSGNFAEVAMADRNFPCSDETSGFKVGGGVKGEGTGGVYSLPLGDLGLCPRENFQITDACR